MTFGSLFAGIGGFDLGLERAGMKCKWQVEIDNFCLKVLNKHWPYVPKFRDIKDVGKENLESIDLICGGFPCQPFSVAGKRAGTKDDRYLWPEMLRVISEIKPSWIITENVPGLCSLDNGLVFESVLSSLENEGYEVQPFIIPACAVDAQHRRDRVWIIAHSISQRLEILPCEPGDNEQKFQAPQRSGVARGWWEPEPIVGRVAARISGRVDRLKALGNAVVPQVVEIIGMAILQCG